MRAVLVGGTGLIGGHVIDLLLAEPSCTEVVSIGRRKQEKSGKKWMEKIGNMADIEGLSSGVKVDVAICCLGTTIKQAGSQEKFADVDLHLPIRFAKAMLANGAKHFHVVSSLGADARASNFYLKTKGQMEEQLRSLGFQSLSIYRPSLLLGKRQETRPMENIMAAGYRFFEPFYPKFLQTWQPIQALDVARVMVARSLILGSGVQVIDNRLMHQSLEKILPDRKIS